MTDAAPRCPHHCNTRGEAPFESARQQQLAAWTRLGTQPDLQHHQHRRCHDNTGSDTTTQTSTSSVPPPPHQRVWPKFSKLLSEIHSANYESTLTCPLDFVPAAGGDDNGALSANDTGKGDRTTPQKTLCPHGVVCLARFEAPADSLYTGLFRGAEHCLLRLSSAAKPPAAAAAEGGFFQRAALRLLGSKLRHARLFPCAALKAFRGGGAPSGNLLFGGCKTGQPETDFFAHAVCTNLTERVALPLRPAVEHLRHFSAYPLSLGVSDWAALDANGQPPGHGTAAGGSGDCNAYVGPGTDGGAAAAASATADAAADTGGNDAVQFPYVVVLSPAAGVTRTVHAATVDAAAGGGTGGAGFDAFLDNLLRVPVGTVVYDMFACPSPRAVSDPRRLQRVGRVVTTSEMRASGPRDGLLFKHQRKEEDFARRPAWREDVQARCSLDGGKTVGTVASLAGWELFEGHVATGEFQDLLLPAPKAAAAATASDGDSAGLARVPPSP